MLKPIGANVLKGIRNWLLFLFLVLIWGSSWPVMKSGLSYVSPLNLTFHRFLLGSLVLSPLLIFLRKNIPRDKETLLKLLLLGIIYAFQIASINMGLAYEKSGVSAMITYTQPLFVFCLAVPFLREKTETSKILGVLIGFCGVAALSVRNLSSFESFSQFGFLLIIGAFLWALTTVYYKKLLTHVDPLVSSVMQLVVGTGLLVFLSSTVEGLSFPFVRSYMLAILYVSIFTTATGLILWIFLLREEDATVLSSSSFIIPIVALFFGWLLLGECIELRSILGIVLIITGVYLVNRP